MESAVTEHPLKEVSRALYRPELPCGFDYDSIDLLENPEPLAKELGHFWRDRQALERGFTVQSATYLLLRPHSYQVSRLKVIIGTETNLLGCSGPLRFMMYHGERYG